MGKSLGFKATKVVLFAAALITAVVAVYTTFALFTSDDLGLQFSPEDILVNRTNFTIQGEGVSFVVEQDCTDESATWNSTNETCKTEVIPPADPNLSPQPGAIGFLATLDIADTPNGVGLAVMILIEIIVIYVVYRELDVFMHDKD